MRVIRLSVTASRKDGKKVPSEMWIPLSQIQRLTTTHWGSHLLYLNVNGPVNTPIELTEKGFQALKALLDVVLDIHNAKLDLKGLG